VTKEPEKALTLSPLIYRAVLFDLDGVVTKTAKVHARAWKKMFDSYLRRRSSSQDDFKPFDIQSDYEIFVDGKPRYDGVKSFLGSRNIDLPYGSPDDEPGKETVCGLGNAKNRLFLEELRKNGVEVYASTIRLIEKLRPHEIYTAVISSSKNCEHVLEAANLTRMFDVKVDGKDVEEKGLKGKPAPDIFLEAALRCGVVPEQAVVMEDALSGVQAGKKGGFGCVVAVDRKGHAQALKDNGADVVVTDLSQIEVSNEQPLAGRPIQTLPPALSSLEGIEILLKSKKPAVFLDYDGTLTPIVSKPDMAVLSDEMRRAVKSLAGRCFVAVISGRDLQDVRNLVKIDGLYYAGSHGFDISGPKKKRLEYQKGKEFLSVLDDAEKGVRSRVKNIRGAQIERKKFSIAVHYRNVKRGEEPDVEKAVDETLRKYTELRKSSGKKVFEIQPRIDWDKGKALMWILESLGMDGDDVFPVYIGDDITDEDAFAVLENRGLGIVVGEEQRSTLASFRLKNPGEVQEFLDKLAFAERGEPE